MSGDPYRARGRNRRCSRWARVKFVLGAHVSSRCAASITGIIAVVSLAVVLLSIAFITGEIGAVKMPPFPSAGPVRWSSSLISPEKEEGEDVAGRSRAGRASGDRALAPHELAITLSLSPASPPAPARACPGRVHGTKYYGKLGRDVPQETLCVRQRLFLKRGTGKIASEK